MARKIRNIISGAAFVTLLFCACCLDSPGYTYQLLSIIAVCAAWLIFDVKTTEVTFSEDDAEVGAAENTNRNK